MKKKFIIFTLCFTFIFSSVNINRSYALDSKVAPLVLTPQLVATVGSYAVACGIVFSSYDQIVNLSHSFYNSISDEWEDFNNSFVEGVSITKDKVVNISSTVKSKLDNFFSVYFSEDKNINTPIVYGQKFYIGNISSMTDNGNNLHTKGIGIYGYFVGSESNIGQLEGYMKWPGSGTTYNSGFMINGQIMGKSSIYPTDGLYISVNAPINGISKLYVFNLTGTTPVYVGDFYNYGSLPTGVYNPGSVNDNINDDESVGIYVPGNVGDLVGVPGGSTVYDGVLNPPYDLPNGGSVAFPSPGENGLVVPGVDTPFDGVDNPSVPDVDNPSVPDVDAPSVPWETITDYIIGLVVPGDTFWTDTWGGLYNNFTESFPMVDMNGFNDLATGEKKFPNIDINIMGVKGRVVNGDIVNSIVDWLRPIVAGFMMLCLMFFNYRKLYKLIRNSEPFEGVGKVENHAN